MELNQVGIRRSQPSKKNCTALVCRWEMLYLNGPMHKQPLLNKCVLFCWMSESILDLSILDETKLKEKNCCFFPDKTAVFFCEHKMIGIEPVLIVRLTAGKVCKFWSSGKYQKALPRGSLSGAKGNDNEFIVSE